MLFAAEPLDPLLSYGPLGIIFVAFFTAFIAGMIYSKNQVADMRKDWTEAMQQVRADSERRETLLREDLRRVEQQREQALDVIQERLLPLLGSFTATTQALLPLLQSAIPILQERAGHQDGGDYGPYRDEGHRGRSGRDLERD